MVQRTFTIIPYDARNKKTITIDDTKSVYDLAVEVSKAFGVALEDFDLQVKGNNKYLSNVQDAKIKNLALLDTASEILFHLSKNIKHFLTKQPNIPCGGKRRGKSTKKTRKSKKSRRQTRRR